MSSAESNAPAVRGWCPGAHRPMMSSDGLVVRVRPWRSTLFPDQLRGLCALARQYGNGQLDLTSRANLQLRAIAPEGLDAVRDRLATLGLLDADPQREAKRNLLLAPDRKAGGLTDRLHDAVVAALAQLPELPQKMGYALDTGAAAQLADSSADFRFELDGAGQLLLRADGAARGRPVEEREAMTALAELADWFVATAGPQAGRMARHLRKTPLPAAWQTVLPRAQAAPPVPGPTPDGLVLGAPFGSLPADALEPALDLPGLTEVRLMTGRLFWLRGTSAREAAGFIATPGASLMDVHACPGAPLCPQATVETRALAARLAGRVSGSLHVSGCAKGCALPRAADITLIGRNGRFDLARHAAPWDAPAATGLDPDQILDLIGTA